MPARSGTRHRDCVEPSRDRRTDTNNREGLTHPCRTRATYHPIVAASSPPKLDRIEESFVPVGAAAQLRFAQRHFPITSLSRDSLRDELAENTGMTFASPRRKVDGKRLHSLRSLRWNHAPTLHNKKPAGRRASDSFLIRGPLVRPALGGRYATGSPPPRG